MRGGVPRKWSLPLPFFEPGAQKRTVLIHHCYEGYNEIKEERIVEIRDTIVKPTYNQIKD